MPTTSSRASSTVSTQQVHSPDSILTEIRRRRNRQEQQRTEEDVEASLERCKTLAGFVKDAWHVVEPTENYVHGWHIDVIADHLTAITYGQINRLIINIPPGTMKSLMASVFWPAWEWGPAGLAAYRYMSTSYSEQYATRDSRRMRALVESEWYQARWPQTELTRRGETSFENISTGWREAMPFRSLTGGRGHRVIIDDPHSTEMAESEPERKTTTRIFREAVPSRMVDPQTSAILVIMQRLHVDDVTGVALALNLGYDHLMLPMEFEPERRCHTSIGFKDPRTYEGELLFPERFPREVIERDKVPMGQYAVAGQFQQRPTLREGGLFKRAWFNVIPAAPMGVRWVRFWDLAATEEQVSADGAYTAGCLLGRHPNGRFVIAHMIRERAEGQGVRKLIRDTAESDRATYGHVEVAFPQDPGQAGKVQGQDLVLMMAGHVAKAIRETGSKLTRAEPVAAQAEAGNIDIVAGPWNESFLDEASDFPGGKFKDQVDALSGAFSTLIGNTVFSTSEDDFVTEAIRIPQLWTRCAALEMDATRAAVLWAAYHRTTDTIYVYDEHYGPKALMPVLAEGIRRRGDWIPVLFDLQGKGRTKQEGANLAMHLGDLNVDLYEAPLDFVAATNEIESRLVTGRLKIFGHLTTLLAEYRRLRRDEKDHIIEEDDLLIRNLAMIVANGLDLGVSESQAAYEGEDYDEFEGERGITGY